MACQLLVLYYIHNDVIKHKTTLHDTSRIISTEILLFQWIHYLIGQPVKNFFDVGKNYLPNGKNVFILFFGLE